MSYYFTNDPNLKSNRRKIEFYFLNESETFYSDDGVFSKDTLDFGSRTLLETIVKEDFSGKVLDLGCGIGVIGILLKQYHPDIEVTMVDVNERAVQLAIDNSALHKQNNHVLVSDGLSKVEDSFDAIVSNPPIRIGKKAMYDLFDQCLLHLKETGILYLVIRKQQGAESAENYLRQQGCRVETINKEKGYWIIKIAKK